MGKERVMKKTYQQPEIDTLVIRSMTLLVGSGIDSNNGMGYGGIDDEGKKDPASKRNHKTWEDWEEEEDEELY